MFSRLSVVFLVAMCVGCGGGPNVQSVTGTITLDGKPISGAVVTFQPIEGGTGQPAVGTTDVEGKYTVTDMKSDKIGSGAAAGEYRVGVMWFKPGADSSQATGASGGNEETAVSNDKKDVTSVSGPEALLPADYQSPTSSGLTASVNAGANTIDFPLVSSYKAAVAK